MRHTMLERARLFGIQSADYITASGHSGRIARRQSSRRKTGRIHDRTRTLRSTVRFLLHRGHPPYMDPALPSNEESCCNARLMQLLLAMASADEVLLLPLRCSLRAAEVSQ